MQLFRSFHCAGTLWHCAARSSRWASYAAVVLARRFHAPSIVTLLYSASRYWEFSPLCAAHRKKCWTFKAYQVPPRFHNFLPEERDLRTPQKHVLPIRDFHDISDDSQLAEVELECLVEEIRQAAHAAEYHLKESLRHALLAGKLLCAAKERIQHGGWYTWLSECEFEFGERTAQRYMRLYQKWQIYVCEQGLESNPTALSDLTMTGFLDAHANILSKRCLPKPGGESEETLNLDDHDELKAQHTQARENANGTPLQDDAYECGGSRPIPHAILEAVELVLGTVDLDPCGGSDKRVSASRYYTTIEEGLDRRLPWSGSVFLCPPTSSELLSKFSARLLMEHELGNTTEAIILVPARTGESWFREFRQHMRAFLASSSTRTSFDFREGIVAIYLGERTRRFYEVFEKHGDCYVPFCARHVRHIGTVDLEEDN